MRKFEGKNAYLATSDPKSLLPLQIARPVRFNDVNWGREKSCSCRRRRRLVDRDNSLLLGLCVYSVLSGDFTENPHLEIWYFSSLSVTYGEII